MTEVTDFGLAFVWPTASLLLVFLLALIYGVAPIRGETRSTAIWSPADIGDW